MKTLKLSSLFALSSFLLGSAFAENYTLSSSETELNWNDPSIWTVGGATAQNAPTSSDVVSVVLNSPQTLILDGEVGNSQNGNYYGTGLMTISNNATWNMGYVYSNGTWLFDVSDSTINGFFAVADGTTTAELYNSTLNGNFDTWGDAKGVLSLGSSTFKGDINFQFSGSSSHIIDISFESSIYNNSKSTKYSDNNHYIHSELNMNFIGSENDISMDVLDMYKGSLSFSADENGFTKVEANKFVIGDSIELKVDFLNAQIQEGTTNFELITVENALSTDILSKISTDFTLFSGDEATLKLSENGKTLFVEYVTSVPEPSTYAMILGALALGFALKRRMR